MRKSLRLLGCTVVIGLVMLSSPSKAQPPYMPKDLSGVISIADAIYALQIASGERNNIWFAPFDLAGDWFIGGSDLQGAHTWDGSITVNSSGAITGGIIRSSEGPTYSISSGGLSVTPQGGVTGFFLDSDGITTQFTMQMNSQKDLMAGEGNGVGNEDGLFVFVRRTPGFLTSDLAGEWFIGGSDLQGPHTWDGLITVSSSGAITGGIIHSSVGPTYTVSSGGFSITPQGAVAGSLVDSDGITTQFTMQMSSQKDVMAGEGNGVGNEDGLFVFIRRSSGFVTGDLAGEWFLGGSDLQGPHTWDGSVAVDPSGAITGGVIRSSEGPTYSISSGGLSVTPQGGVTGSFLDSDGIMTQFTMQMNSQKDLMAGEGNGVGNEDGLFFFCKKKG